MIKILLSVETILVFPFFLLSWLLCGIAFAVYAGFLVAKADGAEKEKVLAEMFGTKKKKADKSEAAS